MCLLVCFAFLINYLENWRNSFNNSINKANSLVRLGFRSAMLLLCIWNYQNKKPAWSEVSSNSDILLFSLVLYVINSLLCINYQDSWELSMWPKHFCLVIFSSLGNETVDLDSLFTVIKYLIQKSNIVFKVFIVYTDAIHLWYH